MTLQALLDATLAGGTCRFPEGHHTQLSKLVVPRPMVLDLSGVTLERPGAEPPTESMLDLLGLGDGADVTILSGSIIGPSTSAWAPGLDLPTAAVDWNLFKTPNAALTVRGLSTSGGFGTGVSKAGGGTLDIADCDLNAWETGFAHFGSHGEVGRNIVRDTVLNGAASKNISVGAYIHPHLNVTWERVTASGWNRYACYLNGTPQSAGHHTFVEVIATDCSLIQTGSSSETTLIRCIEQGVPPNGGSFFKGPVVSIGSTWAARGLIGLMANNPVTRRFVQDTIRPNTTWLAAGNYSTGKVLLYGCTVELEGRDCLLSSNSSSSVAVEIVSTEVVGSSAGYSVNLNGGTLRFLDSDPFPNVRVTAPGALA